jgi:hypothetical protein
MNMRSVRAKEWLADPIFIELFSEMEDAAINSAVYAKPDENERRVHALSEVRAIRSLLSKLNALARDEAKSEGNDAPA